MRLRQFQLAVSLLLVGPGAEVGYASDGDNSEHVQLRREMLHRFQQHYDDVDKGLFEKPRESPENNAKIMISKKDSSCGGQDSPAYYTEFTVHGARPVDVFNVMADLTKWPEWLCKGCTIKLLKNDEQEQVQGFSATYMALPVARREFYQWQVYDADFNTDEFVVGVSGRHNEELHRLKDKEWDSVVGRMCYAYSRITRTPTGAKVVQMTQFNARVPFQVGPFSPRKVYFFVWRMMLERVPIIVAKAKEQAGKNWDPQRLSVPLSFLDNPIPGASQETMQIAARYGVNLPNVSLVQGSGPDFQSQLEFTAVAAGLAVLLCCASALGLLACCRWCPCTSKKGRGITDSTVWVTVENDDELEEGDEWAWVEDGEEV